MSACNGNLQHPHHHKYICAQHFPGGCKELCARCMAKLHKHSTVRAATTPSNQWVCHLVIWLSRVSGNVVALLHKKIFPVLFITLFKSASVLSSFFFLCTFYPVLMKGRSCLSSSYVLYLVSVLFLSSNFNYFWPSPDLCQADSLVFPLRIAPYAKIPI